MVGPPTPMSKPGWALSRVTSSIASSRTRRLFQATSVSVREKTILGLGVQMRPNSTSTGVADGSASAVGQ